MRSLVPSHATCTYTNGEREEDSGLQKPSSIIAFSVLPMTAD
jgi:hypothetical protein